MQGEKRRVEVPFDDALQQEALATLEAARICAESPRPPPLVNSPRCPRCSMVSACLPDEINFNTSNDGDTIKPRKIWPPRDDGIHVVLQQNGAKVGVSGNTLRVTNADGRLLNEVPIVNIESLSVIGGVQVTTRAIQHLSEKSIPIAFMTSAGRTIALVDPLDAVSAEIRKAQVRCCDRADMCLFLTRALVAAKIMNQRILLLRNNLSISAEHLQQMTGMANLVKTAVSIEEVRGYEGQAANLYFINFADMLKEPFAVEFRKYGRQRRPPTDPVNSCLSMAYAMLTHECVSALRIAGLEPSIGAFHVSKPGRPALALDLMEPFRPLIADSLALTGFNRGEFKPEHFERTAAGCIFSDEGRKAFFNAYGRRMATEVKHPVYGYTLSYRRMIVLHARLIAAWMTGEIKSLVFLTTR